MYWECAGERLLSGQLPLEGWAVFDEARWRWKWWGLRCYCKSLQDWNMLGLECLRYLVTWLEVPNWAITLDRFIFCPPPFVFNRRVYKEMIDLSKFEENHSFPPKRCSFFPARRWSSISWPITSKYSVFWGISLKGNNFIIRITLKAISITKNMMINTPKAPVLGLLVWTLPNIMSNT